MLGRKKYVRISKPHVTINFHKSSGVLALQVWIAYKHGQMLEFQRNLCSHSYRLSLLLLTRSMLQGVWSCCFETIYHQNWWKKVFFKTLSKYKIIEVVFWKCHKTLEKKGLSLIYFPLFLSLFIIVTIQKSGTKFSRDFLKKFILQPNS